MIQRRQTSFIKREDKALLLGQGQFAGDIGLEQPLHLVFVRAEVAAGLITGINTDDAREMPGVAGVFTGADVADLGDLSVNSILPISHLPTFEVLAQTHVKFSGQPVAAVLGESLSQAKDAAEVVWVDVDETGALPFQDVASERWQRGDCKGAFETAAHVVSCEVVHPRLAPSPMEPRAIAIAYDREAEGVTIWHSTQTPHRTRSELAEILAIDPDRIRVIARDVGGAFGMKASLYPEEVVAVWAAFQLRRDVSWQATRSDDFLSATHGRGLCTKGELALDANGKFLALMAEIEAPLGAWLPNSALIPAWNAARILPSGYRIRDVDISTKAKQNGLCPTGIYRGAGRPEANMLMERLIDKAARLTGIDPLELRRRNLLGAEELPYETPCGDTLDSGDYVRALDLLADKSKYLELSQMRDRRLAKGELVGIGTSFYVEPSGSGWESARVTLEADGRVTVASGSSSQGHSRETAYAEIAAEALGIKTDMIDVVLADTKMSPEGIGALASRSTAIGGSAVLAACREVSGAADRPACAEVRYENDGQAWGYGAYFAVVSICRDTGVPTVEKVVCVDDAGCLILPELVHGQITGGFAQGLGEAMMEQVQYDAEGQLLTGSFMDYAMPRADTVPPLEIHGFETHSPTNILGAKGVGEAGTIGAPPALLNAVIDALGPLGIEDLQMPLTSYRIWLAIQDAKK